MYPVTNQLRKNSLPARGNSIPARLGAIFLIVCCSMVFSSQALASSKNASGSINWFSYSDGMAEAKKEGKKIFLHFRANWCSYCRLMAEQTFKDPVVIAYLNANYIPITVDTDKETEIAQKYRVTGLPLNWFLEENGEKIGNRPGYISPSDLISFLKFIHTNSYKTMTLSKFLIIQDK